MPTASVMAGVPASNLAEANVGDHVAATEERGHGIEQRFATPQHADARRPAEFVRGEGEEVRTPGLHVGGVVGYVLAAVDDGDGAGRVCGVDELLDGCQRAENVAHRSEGKDLCSVEKPGQGCEVELAVGGEGHPTQFEPALGGEHVPRDDVGVVLHVREDNRVTRTKVGRTPRVRHKVQRLGGVLGEDDFVHFRGVDEPAYRGPRRLERVGGLGGKLVRAAVDRRVRSFHESRHRIDDLSRLLRRVRGVEIDDGLAVDFALEKGEIFLDDDGVEAHRGTPAFSGTPRSPTSRARRRFPCRPTSRCDRRP
jgi:hypothetical protein